MPKRNVEIAPLCRAVDVTGESSCAGISETSVDQMSCRRKLDIHRGLQGNQAAAVETIKERRFLRLGDKMRKIDSVWWLGW